MLECFVEEARAKGGDLSKRWQEGKQLEGEDICCVPTAAAAAVAEHLQPGGCTMPTGTRINYLLLDPIVDISPAGPLSMGLLALGGPEQGARGRTEGLKWPSFQTHSLIHCESLKAALKNQWERHDSALHEKGLAPPHFFDGLDPFSQCQVRTLSGLAL